VAAASRVAAAALAFRSFNFTNIPEGRWEQRNVILPQERRIVITVTGKTQFNNTDVDLFVHRGAGNNDNLVIQDVSIGPHSRVEFVVPANDTYRIRVGNHGPGRCNQAVVTITE